jgi:uncharacterized repeat protein (TIGR02543 family)
MQSAGGMNQAVPSALSPDGSSFTMTDVMISYTVAAAASPTAGGTVAVNTSGPYYYGSDISISETPNPGYTFAGWKATGGSISNSSAATTSLTISTNATLTASFTPIPSYTLSASASPSAGGMVAVSPSQASYLSGTVISISETTNPGYTFAYWTATGGTITSSTAQIASLTITGNCTLMAHFTLNSYSGTEADVGGTIALSNSGPYTYGQVITATETASTDYVFAGWSVTGSVALSSSSAATTSLTVYGNFTLTAEFSVGTLTVSAALDNTWVYQNTPVTTMNRQCRTLTITVPQDSWPDNNFTVQVSTSGSGVVIPSLTFVSPDGSGTVTPTSSFVFSGSSAALYLVGGPRQADGVSGTGSCTVMLQVYGDQSGAANAVTVQAALTVRRLGDTTGDGFVTTADRVQLMKWINGFPTPDQTLANFDLDGDGAVTGNDLAVLNTILNNLTVP